MSRVAVVLVATTLTLQVAVAYKTFYKGKRTPQAAVQAMDSILDVTGRPAQGSIDAPVVLIEFVDFQCPFCKRHADSVRGNIKEKFVDPGRVSYVAVNYPLSAIHPSAELMAGAAVCADEQGRVWDMHARLLATQPTTADFVLALASELRIDQLAFKECVDVRARPTVARDVSVAQALGVQSTPTFAVGLRERGGRVRISSMIHGSQPFSVFEQVIEPLLNTGGTGVKSE